MRPSLVRATLAEQIVDVPMVARFCDKILDRIHAVSRGLKDATMRAWGVA